MAHVVIVDDQAISRKVLEKVLGALEPAPGVESFADPGEALAAVEHAPADLVLTDYRMPGLDGVELTRRIRALPNGAKVPVVLVTAAEERGVRHQALQAGVTDFLTKPVDHLECRVRCANLLRLRAGPDPAGVATAEERERDLLHRLARVSDYHEDAPGMGGARLGHYVRLIGEELGLAPEQARLMELAAPLHDLGNVGLPQPLLLKPAPFTAGEREQMRQHTRIGYQLLANSPSPRLQCAAQVAAAHHERYDGSGYPQGLCGEAIPLAARVTAVADVFDALTSPRPHRPAGSVQQARRYIRERSGAQFDPECAEAFLRRFREVLDIHDCLSRLPAIRAR